MHLPLLWCYNLNRTVSTEKLKTSLRPSVLRSGCTYEWGVKVQSGSKNLSVSALRGCEVLLQCTVFLLKIRQKLNNFIFSGPNNKRPLNLLPEVQGTE